EAMLKEKIVISEAIYIDTNTDVVKPGGRSDAYASSYDLELETYVPLPRAIWISARS
ncbi:hypothetical protein EDC04DRAFT_2573233, partial [Pisolithus marmoratus]